MTWTRCKSAMQPSLKGFLGNIDEPTKPVKVPPRVTTEGEPYYIKGRGVIKGWAFGQRGHTYTSPRPNTRCPSGDAKTNYQLGWYGTVSSILNGTAKPRISSAPPRVKPEGERNAVLAKGRRMKIIVNEYAQHQPTPRNPRVKPEARESAEVHKGGRMRTLIHKHGMVSEYAKAVPRVKKEGEAIARLSTGKRMCNIVHRQQTNNACLSTGKRMCNIVHRQQTNNACLSTGKRMCNIVHRQQTNNASPCPVPRVKPEAGEICEVSKGKRMNRLIHSYGVLPISSRLAPRVKPEAEDNANLDRGGRMRRLMHEIHKLPQTPRPVPRVRSSDAEQIAHYHRGQVAGVLSQIGRKSYIFVPGEQKKMYMQTRTV